jgi:hypothetical protein
VGLLISLIGYWALGSGFGVRGSGLGARGWGSVANGAGAGHRAGRSNREPADSAKAQGLQLIFNLDEAPVVWSDPALDITADVVKLLAQR